MLTVEQEREIWERAEDPTSWTDEQVALQQDVLALLGEREAQARVARLEEEADRLKSEKLRLQEAADYTRTLEILLAWETGNASEGQAALLLERDRQAARELRWNAMERLAGLGTQSRKPEPNEWQVGLLRRMAKGEALTRSVTADKNTYAVGGRRADATVLQWCFLDGLVDRETLTLTDLGRQALEQAEGTEATDG